MVACMTRKPTSAARAATPAPPARPMATPSAKMTGRFPKITSDAPTIILPTKCSQSGMLAYQE